MSDDWGNKFFAAIDKMPEKKGERKMLNKSTENWHKHRDESIKAGRTERYNPGHVTPGEKLALKSILRFIRGESESVDKNALQLLIDDLQAKMRKGK